MNERNLEVKELLHKGETYGFMIGTYDQTCGIFSLKGADYILMFDVHCLNQEPVMIHQADDVFKPSYSYENKYSGLIRDQIGTKGLPPYFDINSYEVEANKQEIEGYYDHAYLIFLPKYTYKAAEDTYHKNLKIIDVINIPEGLHEDTMFKIIPKVSMTKELFEKKLQQKEYFTLEDVPGDLYESVDYIICEDYIYFSDGWAYDTKDPFKWHYAGGDPYSIQVYPIKQKNRRITLQDYNIEFIDEAYLQEIQFHKADFIEKEKVEINGESTQIPNILEEYEFLKSFKELVRKKQLCFEDEDLLNLHICAKSSLLTLISGRCGIGKTQLALQYAEMLDAQEINHTLLFMPITPDYREPEDVLGYLNPSTGLYVTSKCGLVEFLLHAQKHQEKMHVVIFDNMNISPIEYWFSTFISILEKESATRYINLYQESMHCSNASIYPPSIKIGNNILFLGIVHMDDTTKDITPRLLDRSIMLQLNKRKFKDYYQQIQTSSNQYQIFHMCEHAALFNSWCTKENPMTIMDERMIAFFDELDELLTLYNHEMGISYRNIEKTGKYLRNVPYDEHQQPMLDQRQAFDMILKQTVIEKLTGSYAQLSTLIGHMESLQVVPKESKLIELFDQYQDISGFHASRQAMKRKAEDLLTYGYTR